MAQIKTNSGEVEENRQLGAVLQPLGYHNNTRYRAANEKLMRVGLPKQVNR